ncbi:helix-turn-helix domain-containing protein [Lysinibacillus sphaericus]
MSLLGKPAGSHISYSCYAYKLLNSGEIKGFRVGRSWRIPRTSLEEFIINRCRRSHLE